MNDGPPDLEHLLQRGFRYALSLVHDRSRAEDLVQETCVRIARNGGPWKMQYLIRAIRHRFIDEYRRRERLRFVPQETLELRSADATVEWRDDSLERALYRLRPEERELLYLSTTENYSASEIAEISGEPRGTILSRIHRAKQKLRRMLAREEEGKAVS